MKEIVLELATKDMDDIIIGMKSFISNIEYHKNTVFDNLTEDDIDNIIQAYNKFIFVRNKLN
jgi:hypothetical protein